MSKVLLLEYIPLFQNCLITWPAFNANAYIRDTSLKPHVLVIIWEEGKLENTNTERGDKDG